MDINDLHKINRRIVEAEVRIAAQRQRLEGSMQSESRRQLLIMLEESLDLLKRHRKQIIESLTNEKQF